MKPEQQRIAIATACGWESIRWHKLHAGNEGYWGSKEEEDGVRRNRVPDYLNDLNAMHEAEKAKDMHYDQKWIKAIVEVALRNAAFTIHNTDGWDWVALVARLSAAQRAEAFLKTLNLWAE